MWFLVLVMLHAAYRWPESFPDRAACEAAGRTMIDNQVDTRIIDGYACVADGTEAALRPEQ